MVEKHTVKYNSTIKEIMPKLEVLAKDAVLFVVNDDDSLIGSLTDGDVRRGFIRNLQMTNQVSDIMNKNPQFIYENEINLSMIKELREKNYKIIPLIDDKKRITNILNFRIQKSILPCDVVLMAGGKGSRLMPMTENTPKPLLKLGNKPIIETNIDRLIWYGVKNFHISINYLGDQIVDYLGDGKEKGVSIKYIREKEPLGTIGSLGLIEKFNNDHILLMNSDLLTTIDFEEFMIDYLYNFCQMSIVGIPYQVKIPYGVLETDENEVVGIKEKPSYTYYSNGGIYLINSAEVNKIPLNAYYDATDLIDKLIEKKCTVRYFQLMDYWMDIGNHSDYKKAQNDYSHLQLR